MKIRTDFVTNSSSSSFIISKKYLSPDQIDKICHYSELGKEMGIDCWDDIWSIEETESQISGFTWMDNLFMEDFLEKIGVSSKNIGWDGVIINEN